MDIVVRPARDGDLGGIDEIYNRAILTSPATFDLEPKTPQWRAAWFAEHAGDGPHRVIVAVEGDRVVGFASSGPYRAKRGYETSIETSIYVRDGRLGAGIGTALYAALFEALRGRDLHRALAGIVPPNEASVALHERFGFRKVAHFTEQGRKFGRYWDVVWYEKPL
jgi:phosphinothricin acetyltransferase